MTIQYENLVELKKVGLQFGNSAPLFSGLDLKISPRSFQFLTGVSGSGKSTLLKMMYLDQMQNQGEVTIFGQNIRRLNDNKAALFRRKIGVVFQDFRLIQHMTAVENVALPLKVDGVDAKKRTAEAKELLDWVGLQAQINSRPPQMSGGQQQRVAIARAIINRPHLLLADEPTGNVDDTVAMRLIYLFEKLHKSGTSIVIATHNRVLARSFNHPLLAIHNGGICHAEKMPSTHPNKAGSSYV